MLQTGSRSPAAGPFFAFLHLFEPHSPYEPPEPYRSRYPLLYDGEIARADEILGQFVRFLKDRDIYDRALVIFLSDHGEGLNDHGEDEQFGHEPTALTGAMAAAACLAW